MELELLLADACNSDKSIIGIEFVLHSVLLGHFESVYERHQLTISIHVDLGYLLPKNLKRVGSNAP